MDSEDKHDGEDQVVIWSELFWANGKLNFVFRHSWNYSHQKELSRTAAFGDHILIILTPITEQMRSSDDHGIRGEICVIKSVVER